MQIPLAYVEPHAQLLRQAPRGQLLYKVMSAENLRRSIEGRYLHFNRVDSYIDSPHSDKHDGEQLPSDRPGNKAVSFQKSPTFTTEKYYDQARSRTYACCFSIEESEYIWRHYGGDGANGKACVVFDLDKLRAKINPLFEPGQGAIEVNGKRLQQILSINYGLVEYVDWHRHQSNGERLPNPIQYTYMKDHATYREEKELRISLSAIGVGHFVLDDGTRIEFPPHLQVPFDFSEAKEGGVIKAIKFDAKFDTTILPRNLRG